MKWILIIHSHQIRKESSILANLMSRLAVQYQHSCHSSILTIQNMEQKWILIMTMRQMTMSLEHADLNAVTVIMNTQWSAGWKIQQCALTAKQPIIHLAGQQQTRLTVKPITSTPAAVAVTMGLAPTCRNPDLLEI